MEAILCHTETLCVEGMDKVTRLTSFEKAV